ncbi:hypothetical protein KC207_05330 [Phycicoccus sp. BSK3Z-2]|uniref:Uncharacterized protein n=1 Tax=Phycicoccus avicenniae TaxID=2828860 RepID=A0A941D8C6_9MICO|nr:hypothetical protein [Phycicoccus avicenniae]MBR7742710.1 hypothetical protein [Phycicoccus avicenniae]
MTLSIGRPVPDCHDRRDAAATRRAALTAAAGGRGDGVTRPNGEETHYDDHALSFHKTLPHDPTGAVHRPSHAAMVRAVTRHDEGALETLPVGRNRTGSGATPEDPPRYTTGAPSPTTYRRLTSPLTGHVYDVEGADAGAFAIAPAPLLATDELAAEMAELYAMALLRDVPFTAIADESGPDVTAIRQELDSMPFLAGTATPRTRAGRNHLAGRAPVVTGADLFRGSTPGSRSGPWLSQYLLVGSDNSAATVEGAVGNSAASTFPGERANLSEEDGFVLFGTQVVDQRSIVAVEGVDWMTTWASWLDCQNGVDFNGLDVFRPDRRFLTTPRDVATYVHYDALYQAYLVACLIMLADGTRFPKDPGLPESDSRTRSAFASFGGPHVLALVTEVSSRALKAVWRQKWMHHRRARPEVVAALLTLNATADAATHLPQQDLRDALDELRGKIPPGLLARVSAHNAAQNARTDGHVVQDAAAAAGLPTIEDSANFLLPMAFPEGSPTHPAYGAGHATVAGACVTVLEAMFDMHDADGSARAWPYPAFVAEPDADGTAHLAPASPQPTPGLTVQGELDKLAANISIARNIAGVHYFTDYYESVRLGERVATSILEEQLGMYAEPVSVSFTSFDGDTVEVVADGSLAQVRVRDADGDPVTAADWFGRYSS